mgnify:FL=1|tara:strand:+ start:58127 stop:59992 length:1866 start_codon:yes stop_codon:yes gene_type:complete
MFLPVLKIMKNTNVLQFTSDLIQNIPSDWLNLTTHRLDIYNESLAKSEFLSQLETLFQKNNTASIELEKLPTAYDYIRLGHPLSSVLEWALAKQNNIPNENVICFSSQITPILAVLRKNLLDSKNTRIVYSGELPNAFHADILKSIYGYHFELLKVNAPEDAKPFNGSSILISSKNDIGHFPELSNFDFLLNLQEDLGSIILVNPNKATEYISEIQHVRRRETIAMTPANALKAIQKLIGIHISPSSNARAENKAAVLKSINTITQTFAKPIVASSGLSMQYAIVMGLIHDAMEKHPQNDIKILVPPNCYGGTNDQARRLATCLENVQVLDLPVDGDNDMVLSIDRVLEKVASQNAIAFIIAEIPTNPRVEVPELQKLQEVLTKVRKTAENKTAISPVFILDQTFCPNVNFLGEEEILSSVKTIAYVSGSKFPSGGKCTAGYCVANNRAADLLEKIELHLKICDNEATPLQYEILAKQMPSMIQRIKDAYQNTRDFVNFIQKELPAAKINFVSEELAKQGFTPSVFSLDLPTKGNTDEERENYKRALNLKLINMMITHIPEESKYCVSYGQLKGCYWTIPATSTQGTTKEGDKDYIARVALSPNMDLDHHKKIFKEFVESL